VLTPDGKVEIAETLMRHYGIGREDVIAYGDSASDIPLFQTLGHTVSVNGSERLRVLAAASYEGDDIWEAYMLGRSVAAI
jgi:phosphoserine phosphatase